MTEPQPQSAGDGHPGGGVAIATGFLGPEELGDRIAALSTKDAAKLVRYLREKHGIDFVMAPHCEITAME